MGTVRALLILVPILRPRAHFELSGAQAERSASLIPIGADQLSDPYRQRSRSGGTASVRLLWKWP